MRKQAENAKNVLMLVQVARALGDLRREVAFVGGAAVELYLDDEGAPMPTASDDVDFVVELSAQMNYARLETELRRLGFRDPIGEDNAPICRKYLGDIQVDVMPTDPSILGFSNPWYGPALKTAGEVTLPGGEVIRIFSVPYFVASKLAAYWDRGVKGDPWGSQDLEDICSLLDGCSALGNEIAASPSDVQAYIRESFQKLLNAEIDFEEIAYGFLRAAGEPAGRVQKVMQIARAIAWP